MNKQMIAQELVKIAKGITSGSLEREREASLKNLKESLEKTNKMVDTATKIAVDGRSLQYLQDIGELLDKAESLAKKVTTKE
jgi:predicted Zn-dependent peptidase